MRTTSLSLAAVLAAAAAPSARAWGTVGHEAVAYVASDFVTNQTRTWAQGILGDTSSSYMASVATWADSFRYTAAGHFSRPFHYLDAQDNPPHSCGVDFTRDCGPAGCIVSAIQNYTSRVQDTNLSAEDLSEALRFLIHFIGDVHQPLHDENLDVGGNTIKVSFNGTATNLHAVWDTSIPEGFAGSGKGAAGLENAAALGAALTDRIRSGDYQALAPAWLQGISLADPQRSALTWAGDANAYVCTVVIPNGVAAVDGQDLGTDYYTSAAPTAELLLATAGYRLAAWLNLIATGKTWL